VNPHKVWLIKSPQAARLSSGCIAHLWADFSLYFLGNSLSSPTLHRGGTELNSLFQTLASPWGDLKAENSENKVHAVKFILRYLRRERSKILECTFVIYEMKSIQIFSTKTTKIQQGPPYSDGSEYSGNPPSRFHMFNSFHSSSDAPTTFP
jgi:hypothetical protein